MQLSCLAALRTRRSNEAAARHASAIEELQAKLDDTAKSGDERSQQLEEQLTTFDVATTQAFLPEDHIRLMNVIEDTFGDLAVFNKLVQSMLQKYAAHRLGEHSLRAGVHLGDGVFPRP